MIYKPTRYSSSGDSAKSPEGPPPAEDAVVETVWRSMSEMRQSPLLALKVADLEGGKQEQTLFKHLRQ